MVKKIYNKVVTNLESNVIQLIFFATFADIRHQLALSLGDLINPDGLINLYCDQIHFFDPNLKPDLNLSRRNQLNQPRNASKFSNLIEFISK